MSGKLRAAIGPYHALTRILGSSLIALALTLTLFSNRARLLQALADLALYWLPAMAALALVMRLFGRARWAATLARSSGPAAIALFFASATAAWWTSSNAGRFARHVVEFLLVFLPVLMVAHWRTIAGRWRDVVAVTASSLAVILLLWATGPFIMRRFILPQYVLDLDHRPRPLVDGTNEDGAYSSRSSRDFTPDGFNIVCLGDSFTANPHLRPAERYPDILEALLRSCCLYTDIKVVNFGWVSSSPVLQARRLRDVGARYRPDLVIQAIDMTDFHDDLRAEDRLRQLDLKGEGHGLTVFNALNAALSRALEIEDYTAWLRAHSSLLPPAPASPIPRRRFFALFEPLSTTEPFLEPTWRAILETEREARSLGARFALFILPRYQQYNRDEAPNDRENRLFPQTDEFALEPFRFFDSRRNGIRFPIHSLREDFLDRTRFPTCFDDDPHWNAAGNRLAAEAMVRYLAADELLPCGKAVSGCGMIRHGEADDRQDRAPELR